MEKCKNCKFYRHRPDTHKAHICKETGRDCQIIDPDNKCVDWQMVERAPTGASREKYWQEKAGEFASIANWALLELLDNVEVGSNEHGQANDHLNEVIPFLDFSEEIE